MYLAIYLELERMGFSVWYDNRADDLTKEGMRRGIINSGAFILFLSAGVLSRPFCGCQFEIRTAIAHKKTIVLIHESDARHGAYDFYAEQLAAPDDLKYLTDLHESMAFRRRGYERDALLSAVVERAGFGGLVQQREGAQEQKQRLAALPSELAHFDLERFRDRPVQAEIVALMMLRKGEAEFSSSVLIHGMGGTGKTVMAVAVLQETAIRHFYFEIYWLTVGADAVGEKIKQLQTMLYKKLSGTGMKDADAKGDHERQAMLVDAMVEKKRALVVLDDPWMPEQVRFLNPIDTSQTGAHRLLITTRIRDLVPKATRVELPLMGKDEAVALLLDLANIEESSYLKEHPGATWPPQAAYTIATECGLLPITLIIAAQVVRSWGSGWETAVLPLLREQQGSGGTSTVEERVIGAGLKALEKHEDGAAVKELFHTFAVTQEDFLHPMAVIELLWRSCCASESEKQEGGLSSRLQVRQRTQMLLDLSLLLGSSSEGVHLHDIVLQYLRKRLSAEETRELHYKTIEGIVATAAERLEATGRGLEDTGTSMGSWHMRQTLASPLEKDEHYFSDDLRRYLLLEDHVISHQASCVIGEEGLKALATEYISSEQYIAAAKAQYALVILMSGDRTLGKVVMKEAQMNLERSKPLPRDGLQIEWLVLVKYAWYLSNGGDSAEERAEKARIEALTEKAAENKDLQRDPITVWMSNAPKIIMMFGQLPSAFNGGRTLSSADLYAAIVWSRDDMIPLIVQKRDQSVGARREFYECLRCMSVIPAAVYPVCHGARENAQLVHAMTTAEWGGGSDEVVDAMRTQSFARHHTIARKSNMQHNQLTQLQTTYIAERRGNLQHWLDAFDAQHRYTDDYYREIEAFSAEDGLEMISHYNGGAAEVGIESAHFYPFRQKVLKPLQMSFGSAGREMVDEFRERFFATLALTSPASVSMGYLDTLPAVESPALHCVWTHCVCYASIRTMLAEVMEQQGRHAEAVALAQADLQVGVRERALLGAATAAEHKEGAFSGLHWDGQTAQGRLQEVMGRMDGDGHGGRGLLEKLLLHAGGGNNFLCNY
eukprot:g28.t1